MARRIKNKGNSEFTAFEDTTYKYSKSGPKRTSTKKLEPVAEVLETLYSEHRYFNRLLDKLELEAEKLVPGKIPDFHLLLDIVDYLKHYPGKYHHPRENLLFTILLKQNKDFRKYKVMLENDHEKLDQLNQALFTQLTGIVKGDTVNRAALAKRINNYLHYYRKHIDFESKEIFPMTTGELSTTELNKLRLKTRYINDPLFSSELGYKYHRLARNLTYEIGVESSRLAEAELGLIESFIGKLTQLADTSQQLKSSLRKRQKDSLREQLQICREGVDGGFSNKLLILPLTLANNQKKQLQYAWRDVTKIIRR